MLEGLFGNRTVERVLFFLSATEEAYPREIARVFSCALSPIQRQFDRLENAGIVSGRLRGRVRLYSFNPACPYMKELRALLVRTMSLLPAKEWDIYNGQRRRPRRRGKA